LGFAPESIDGLINFAKKKGLSDQTLVTADILRASSYGREPYSRFGGRIIFPIIDQTARVIGFGGRLLEGDGAKYLNTTNTPAYNKSRVLYGIYQARDSLKKSRTAIVVEGYMDVIALHEVDITNTIAASGTSFTPEQARILSRMVRKVILLFDGDPAGYSAAARGADNLLTADLDIGIVPLPEGYDPDSFVREKGAGALQALLDSPVDLWDFKIREVKNGEATPEDLTRIAGEVADSLSLINDDMKREVYTKKMSLALQIEPNTMIKAVA
jgi:DNA primase